MTPDVMRAIACAVAMGATVVISNGFIKIVYK